MSKVAVVYFSMTGNTRAMADAVADGVRNAGGTADVMECNEFNSSLVNDYDAIAFGCPAMGAEQLEESSFEPMFTEVEGSLSNKKVGLFGSYGWGSGEWMQIWSDRTESDGAKLVGEPVIANYTPDAEAIVACNDLGAKLC